MSPTSSASRSVPAGDRDGGVDADPDPGTGAGTDADMAVDDLAHGLVAALGLRRPWVHLGFVVVLGVLGAVCLLAAVTRGSALPLVPLAPLCVASWFAWRARTASADRPLLGHVTLFAVSVAVGLWLMSFVARMLP